MSTQDFFGGKHLFWCIWHQSPLACVYACTKRTGIWLAFAVSRSLPGVRQFRLCRGLSHV